METKEKIFYYSKEVQHVCLEFGITDLETMNYMFEVAKMCRTGSVFDSDRKIEEARDEGYKEGYDEAIEEVGSKIDDLVWEIERLKKN